MPPQQTEAKGIDHQCQSTDGAHGFEGRRLGKHQFVNEFGQNEKPKACHHPGFGDGGPSLPAQPASDHPETERVDQRITQHVQRVGQERDGACPQSGHEFNREHHSIKDQDSPERSALTDVQLFQGAGFIVAATGHIRVKRPFF